jgi:hypothetical protein
MFVMRKLKRNRNRPISDFGFNRDDMAVDKSAEHSVVDEKLPEMFQPGHSVAPSIGGAGAMAGYGSSYDNAQSDEAAAARARAPLQERPKYVYGQGPANGHSDDDINGVYSSEPTVLTSYNPEAYGSYAQYEGTGVAQGGGYQDAQREYQGQPGQYNAQEYAAYSQYAGYDQEQYGTYEQNQYGDYNQQNQRNNNPHHLQEQYQAPHPYSSASPAASGARTTDDAYGGM